jgi:hypothetical protein
LAPRLRRTDAGDGVCASSDFCLRRLSAAAELTGQSDAAASGAVDTMTP